MNNYILPDKEVLTVEDLMKFFGRGKNTIYKLTNSGRLKSRKEEGLGRVVLRTWLVEYLDKLSSDPPANGPDGRSRKARRKCQPTPT